MNRMVKMILSITFVILFLFSNTNVNAQNSDNLDDINVDDLESFTFFEEDKFNYEESLNESGKVKYDILISYEIDSLEDLPNQENLWEIALEQYPEISEMDDNTYYLNLIGNNKDSRKERTTESEMLNPNPYGSTTFNVNGGDSIKVWKAPSTVSFANVTGSVSGLTFATYKGKLAYCVQPGTLHGGGTISSDPLSVFTNYAQSHQVSRWARASEYYQSVDSKFWGEYVGVAQDKIWGIMGRNNTGSSISSTYYNRVSEYKNALDNPNVVSTNLPPTMQIGEPYEIIVQYGKVYNHIVKLSNNYDIKLSSNSINNNKLDLRAVYTVTPKASGDFGIRFLSEPSGQSYKANYIYGSNQNLFVGDAIDPNMKQFNVQIIGEGDIVFQKNDTNDKSHASASVELLKYNDVTKEYEYINTLTTEDEIEMTLEDYNNLKNKDDLKNVVINEETQSVKIPGAVYISKLEFGQYAFKEITAPSGTVLYEDLVEFDITEHGVVAVITLDNEVIKSNIIVQKIDENSKTYSGASIEVLDSNKEIITTLVTEEELIMPLEDYNRLSDEQKDGLVNVSYNKDNDTVSIPGAAYVEDVEFGINYLREIKAPSGTVLNKNLIEFEVTEDGAIIVISFVNMQELASTGYVNLTYLFVFMASILLLIRVAMKNQVLNKTKVL